MNDRIDNPPGTEAGTAATGKPTAGGYRVLARKYRPTTFEDLIGQEAMIRTLANAFETGRIAQAYLLTGVRGVGKTTTARLIARALNYTGPGGEHGPSLRMPVMAEHCEAIVESRHVDVLEMDAASHTQVEKIRELMEGMRYRPVAARYKVYIVDEVHMLSKSSFNALLKTLEEPPPHIKFIFATTEVRKVPVTVLSRCQRFDLRRLDAAALVEHYRKVAAAEAVGIEDEALRLIARAAEGSVRDGLSLLDQAIAYGAGNVTAAAVRSMLGLNERARIIELFAAVMAGRAAEALAEFKAQYDLGADPESVLADLAEFVHWVTRLKVVPEAAGDPAKSEVERVRGAEYSGRLAMPALTRAWQMLLKGMAEVKNAANPLLAAEMVLIRLAYAAELPTPEEIVRNAQNAPAPRDPAGAVAPSRPSAERRAPGDAGGSASAIAPMQALPRREPTDPEPPAAAPPPRLASFADVVALVGERRDVKLKAALERQVRPGRVAPGSIEIGLEPGAPAGLPNELARKLEQWTGMRWMVAVSMEADERPLAEQQREQRDSLFRAAREHPTVRAVLDRFPGAEIVDVREPDAAADAPAGEEIDN